MAKEATSRATSLANALRDYARQARDALPEQNAFYDALPERPEIPQSIKAGVNNFFRGVVPPESREQWGETARALVPDPMSIMRGSEQAGDAMGRGDVMGALGGVGAMGAGALDSVPGPLKVLRKGAIKGVSGGGISKGAAGAGGTPPPSGVPAYGRVPQLPLSYPPIAPPAWTTFKNPGRPDKEGFAKVNSPEAREIQTRVGKAQSDIGSGNYTPYYDVSKRADVDPSNYPFSSVDTLSGARPAKQATIDKYVAMARTPAARANLINAYNEGKKIPDSDRWYFMKQLEDSFIKEYGPVKGRKMFDEKFATSMAATTGGSSPKENLRVAMYGNYLRENGLPYPKNGYELPYPIGGRYVQTNVDMHSNLLDKGSIDPVTNPKRVNFRGNFLGEKAATLDEQMMGLFDPSLKIPPGSSYGIFEEALNDAARGVKKDPRAFQDVTWAGAKKIKEGKNYPGSKPMIQEVNEMIERTSRVTGLSPEDVVKLGLIRSKIPLFSAAPVGAGLGAALSSMGARTESEGGI